MNDPLITQAKAIIGETQYYVSHNFKQSHGYDPTTITALMTALIRRTEALEGLTNAALAGLKPLPSQVEAAFKALQVGDRD
jgi:hypothetical protein